jgi:hypothetical protein
MITKYPQEEKAVKPIGFSPNIYEHKSTGKIYVRTLASGCGRGFGRLGHKSQIKVLNVEISYRQVTGAET